MLSQFARGIPKSKPRYRTPALNLEKLERRDCPSITIQIDYSLDTNNFFDSARRGAIQRAADTLSSLLQDSLDSIVPSGTNTWSATFGHPGTGERHTIANMNVSEDTLIVFAGGRELGSSLGLGGPGGVEASGSSAWVNRVLSRGEPGALLDTPTDLGIWGGSITFDITTPWFTGATTEGLAGSGQQDLFTVALHELVHLLGFGTSASWNNQISGGTFSGNASRAAFDQPGNPPVDGSAGHWAQGITDEGLEPLMNPVQPVGVRKQLTGLDIAALDDIGWDTSTRLLAVGADAGGGPHVKVFDSSSGALKFSFFPYSGSFTGGVRVAVGDVNNDRIEDFVTAAGPGGGPHVKVFDGSTGGLLSEFFAYDASFAGGVFVSVGDIDNDGFADIITGAGAGGGPHVKVFSGGGKGILADFFAYAPSFLGGVRVAVGNLDNDNFGDIITGAGAGGSPHVRVFSGGGKGTLADFFAFDANFLGGVYVASGDLNNDGFGDLIVGSGAGGGSLVRAFGGNGAGTLADFVAFGGAFTGGSRVSSTDRNGDGVDDMVVGAGPGGGPNVKVFNTTPFGEVDSFFAFAGGFSGGLFVG